jgi:hypothetical protein
MAPADMSAKQKVRFMEIVAASMEDSQAEGKITFNFVQSFEY